MKDMNGTNVFPGMMVEVQSTCSLWSDPAQTYRQLLPQATCRVGYVENHDLALIVAVEYASALLLTVNGCIGWFDHPMTDLKVIG